MMEDAEEIMRRRSAIWNAYHSAFAIFEEQRVIRRPLILSSIFRNAHLYYLLLPDLARRTHFIEQLRGKSIHSVFHYIPLHDSFAGRKYCRIHGELSVTNDISARLVRLPLWIGMEDHLDYVIEQVVADAQDTLSVL